MILKIHALSRNQHIFIEGIDRQAYKRPAVNTADTPSLLLFDICSYHILPIGRTKIEKSEMILITAPAISTAGRFMQRPFTVGFQIFSLGRHPMIWTSITAM